MKNIFSLFLSFAVIVLYLIFAPESLLTTYDTHKENVKRDEKYYQTKMCNEFGGKMEYVLFDKARVDCLTNEYAIEVDFAKKWAEGVGQALYYAEITGKKPAIGLIVGSDDDAYLKRVGTVAEKFDIKIIILKR